MEIQSNFEQILPFHGEGLAPILDLARAENSAQATQGAWQKIAQQVADFSENSPCLDFNAIAQDLLTLQVLLYPIVMKHAPQALDSDEANRIQDQIQATLETLKALRENLKQTQRQDADFAKQLLPFFEKLKTIHQEMRAQWDEYHQNWQTFQASTEDALPEQEPPMPAFNQIRWHVLRLCFRLLMAEVEYRQKSKEGLHEVDQIAEYPLLPLLVQEIRTLHARTQGFELLEKAQLTQKRTQQLAQQLQFFHAAEPILPQNKSLPSKRTEQATSKKGALPALKKNRKILLWGLPALGLGFALLFFPFLVQNPKDTFQSENSGPTLIRQQNVSFGVAPSQPMKKPMRDLQQMVQTKGLKIPIYAPNENLKKSLEAATISRETLRKITEEAQSLTVIFVAGESAYLVSGEGVLPFDSLEKLKNFFDKVAQQYEQLVQIAAALQQAFAQYEITVLLPEATGEPGYGLALRDEEQRMVGQIRFSQERLTLQWDGASETLLSQIPPLKNVQGLVDVMRTLGAAP